MLPRNVVFMMQMLGVIEHIQSCLVQLVYKSDQKTYDGVTGLSCRGRIGHFRVQLVSEPIEAKSDDPKGIVTLTIGPVAEDDHRSSLSVEIAVGVDSRTDRFVHHARWEWTSPEVQDEDRSPDMRDLMHRLDEESRIRQPNLHSAMMIITRWIVLELSKKVGLPRRP